MSKKGGGVVPFVTAGFPNGAGSAKQAVQMEISNQNKLQADANMIVGGLQNKKMRARRSAIRRTARHGSAKSARRTAKSSRRSARHGSAKGGRKSAKGGRVSKARGSKARRTARLGSAKGARRIYKGGLDSDNSLVDGEQLAVPQFGPSVGPLNPNSASVLTNSILLKAQQDSAYDKQISN